MVKVGILGAAGYTGGELIRLLLNHPQAEIIFANSESNAGNRIYENFHSQWQKYWRFLKITGRGGITVYATSSVYDRDNAWKYAMGYAEDYLDHAYQKESLKADWGTVRAVAAF